MGSYPDVPRRPSIPVYRAVLGPHVWEWFQEDGLPHGTFSLADDVFLSWDHTSFGHKKGADTSILGGALSHGNMSSGV